MQYFKRLGPLVLAAAGLSSGVAWADGTDANTDVVNTATLTYSVNSVSQTATTSATFRVDRRLQLEVTSSNTDYVTAIPGQLAADNPAAAQFLVTNNSNDTVDVVLALIDQGATQVTGFPTTVSTDAIAPANITVFIDDNGDGILDGGETVLGNAPGAYTGAGQNLTLLEDADATISVIIDVAGTTPGEFFQTYTLVAAAANGTAVIGNDDSGNISPGGTASDIANRITELDTVFADAGSANAEDEGFNFIVGPAGTGLADADNDGQSADTSGFRTQVALGVAKFVEVVFDPISGNRYNADGSNAIANNPKAIPGAVLMYVVGVASDATSTLTSDTVLINDDIPVGDVVLGTAETGIAIPDSVTFSVNGAAVVFDLDNTAGTGVVADSQVHVQACGSAVLTDQDAFGADPAEVNGADLGTCDPGESGYVVYFVTVDDTAS